VSDQENRTELILAANHDAFSEAIARGDAAAAAAVYAENTKLMAPGEDVIEGQRGAEAFWGRWIRTGLCGAEHRTLELEPHDDAVYEIGRYSIALAPKGATATIDQGKYLVIHKRQPDGSWKWAVDIFNSDRDDAWR
jgi:ketosteroid isomerase-like protein